VTLPPIRSQPVSRPPRPALPERATAPSSVPGMTQSMLTGSTAEPEERRRVIPGRVGRVARGDRWADWLTRGRSRGLSRRQLQAMSAELSRVRDRVVRRARLRHGETVIDVGAGTGFLAIEALARVGERGSVVALDLSRDVLEECTTARSGGSQPAPGLVVGDAASVPLKGRSVDAVIARSVLIYVVDKARVAREMHRVLRPGGRVSIFEPINRHYRFFTEIDLSELEPDRGRVLERWHRDADPGGAMSGFDERDLVRVFEDAGFETVELSYERVHTRTRGKPEQVMAHLSMRPNPNMVSYEEAAREVLGEVADEHLAALAAILTSRPSVFVSAGAYLRCRRSRRSRA
jgi:arsenite methyltransferase